MIDTGTSGTSWTTLSWTATVPQGTTLKVSVRAAETLFDAADVAPSWTLATSDDTHVTSGLPPGRYLQWMFSLATENTALSPILEQVTVVHARQVGVVHCASCAPRRTSS